MIIYQIKKKNILSLIILSLLSFVWFFQCKEQQLLLFEKRKFACSEESTTKLHHIIHVYVESDSIIDKETAEEVCRSRLVLIGLSLSLVAEDNSHHTNHPPTAAERISSLWRYPLKLTLL